MENETLKLGKGGMRVIPFNAEPEWAVWQLANDEDAYGADASRYIVVTADGEDELDFGIMDLDEAQAIVDRHNEGRS